MPRPLALIPTPRHVEPRAGEYKLESGKRIALAGAPAQDLLPSAQRLCSALREHARVEWNITATATGNIGATLGVDAARAPHAEGYALDLSPDGIQVFAASPRGIFYAVCTLLQLIAASPYRRLPCLRIADHPDFPHRGVMLDISRDKVPTLRTLFDLVELLATWKINQLQLYTEHTFAYQNHPQVWKRASPLTAQEILELDAFCRARFIELVPNQNSFGHMHRWLRHARYAPLAEVPHPTSAHWWGKHPFSLCPTDPGSLALLRELYDELLPNFSSRQFNVGCDETFDLGQGRSKAECERRGAGRVYLDFLLKIHREVTARGRTMQFWGDIIIQHPELIAELPRDAIALEWGYEADHPFDEDGARFAAAGVPFYVCPGTSSWNSIAGRTENTIANIRNAAKNGLKHGAIGLLNTDWGDNGHWQYLPISFLGLGYGAAMSWCVEANRDLDLARAISLYAFRDPTGALGHVAFDLGNAYKSLGIELHNSTALFRLLHTPLPKLRDEIYGLTPAALQRAQGAIDHALQPLARARSARDDARLIADEFASAAALLRHACQRGLLALTADPAQARALKRHLARDLDMHIAEYTRLWHARNRPGGFRDSVARLEKLRKDYT